MKKTEAEAIVRLLWRDERPLERTKHFWEKAEKEGYTIQDVRKILRSHSLEDDPEEDSACGNFVVRLRGKSLDGRDTRLVLGLRHYGPCSVISIIDVKHTRKRS